MTVHLCRALFGGMSVLGRVIMLLHSQVPWQTCILTNWACILSNWGGCKICVFYLVEFGGGYKN